MVVVWWPCVSFKGGAGCMWTAYGLCVVAMEAMRKVRADHFTFHRIIPFTFQTNFRKIPFVHPG